MSLPEKAILLVVSVVVFGIAACRCSEEPAETRIRELVERAVELVEKKDVAGLMELTTSDFVARPGNRDRRETKRILLYLLLRHRDVRILHPSPSIRVDPAGTAAHVEFPFVLIRSGSRGKGDAGTGLEGFSEDFERWAEKAAELARVRKIRLVLRLEDGEWKVQQATLSKVLPGP